jgi:hypothetical protein
MTPIFIPFGESPGNNNWDRGKSDGRADVIQAEAELERGKIRLAIYLFLDDYVPSKSMGSGDVISTGFRLDSSAKTPK